MPRGIYKRTSEMKTGKYKRTPETKRKMSEAHLRLKPSEETKRKISKSLKGRYTRGNNSNWRGGKSFEPYTTNWTETLRRSIRERDHYTCQLCGKLQGDRIHSIHHIDYNKKNCNPSNFITLCVNCNTKVNYNRKYWEKFLRELNEK